MDNQLEKYIKKRDEHKEFHEKEGRSYPKGVSFEMAFNVVMAIIVYFLADYLGFNETSSVLIAVGVAFMLTAKWLIHILLCIENAVLWVKDDLNNMHNYSVKSDADNKEDTN